MPQQNLNIYRSSPLKTHLNTMSGRGKGKTAKKAVSRSAKAGLQVTYWPNALSQMMSCPTTTSSHPLIMLSVLME